MTNMSFFEFHAPKMRQLARPKMQSSPNIVENHGIIAPKMRQLAHPKMQTSPKYHRESRQIERRAQIRATKRAKTTFMRA